MIMLAGLPAVRENNMRAVARVARVFTLSRYGWRVAAMILLGGLAGIAAAQAPADTPRSDPPSRVARLSYVVGDLGFLPQGASNWSDARINRPLTTGDRLSSGHDTRAELELGGSSLRIAGNTDLGLLNLNGQLGQFALTQGSLELTVHQLASGQSYEIDTPTIAVVVDQPGRFRVDIQDGGRNTRVTAFAGNATVYGEHQTRRTVFAGRRYRFDDSMLQVVEVSTIGSEDAFDYWSQRRDRRYTQSHSRRYVSDQVVGYQDLDDYGSWQTNANYGAVWFPRDVSSDWAPYRDGHWAYIPPWGWTWVDDSPWGFAPYHYGRWIHLRRGWGWIPGPLAVQPVYAPALVVFVGGNWSVGISIAPIGWFPLGPGEIYNPWYHASRHYYTHINVTNIHTTPRDGRHRVMDAIDTHYRYYRDDRPYRDRHYVNRHAPHAFTAVSEKAFADGSPVRHEMLHLDRRQRAAAAVLPDGTPLHPAARSQTAPRSPHVGALPREGFRRRVVVRHSPPQPLADQRVAPDRRFTGSGAAQRRRLPAHVGIRNPPQEPQAAGVEQSPRTPGRTFTTNRADQLRASPELRQPANPRLAAEAAANMPQTPPTARRTANFPSAGYIHPRRSSWAPDQHTTPAETISPPSAAPHPRVPYLENARGRRDSSRMPAPAVRAARPRFEQVNRIPVMPTQPTVEPRSPVAHLPQMPVRAAARFTPPPQPAAVRTPQPRSHAPATAKPRQPPGSREQRQ